MSIKEIAEAMGTSESTVKSRLRYARESIRQGVEKYTDQGFKFYGLTPVPFLRYFLQKEAARVSGMAAGRAALAAFSAAGEAPQRRFQRSWAARWPARAWWPWQG